MVERKFGVEIEDWFEVGRSEASASVGIELRAQLRNAVGGERESDCVGVSAIAMK